MSSLTCRPRRLDELFQLFLQERRYLLNVTPRTLSWYEAAWLTFKRSSTPSLTNPVDLKREDLERFVYVSRDRGVKPITVNSWVRALNAFFRWLHTRGTTDTQIKLRAPRFEKRLIATLDTDSIRKLISFKPRGRLTSWRIHALVCALLDTGCRVTELLDARVEDFDFDDLLLTVIGKGNKQRRIPFSIELRKILYRYSQVRGNTERMFPAQDGGRWIRRNALRSFYLFQDRLGLKRVGFHRLRHTFATEYLRRGGEVVRLSRTLGHSQITTTMKYLHLLTEDLAPHTLGYPC